MESDELVSKSFLLNGSLCPGFLISLPCHSDIPFHHIAYQILPSALLISPLKPFDCHPKRVCFFFIRIVISAISVSSLFLLTQRAFSAQRSGHQHHVSSQSIHSLSREGIPKASNAFCDLHRSSSLPVFASRLRFFLFQAFKCRPLCRNCQRSNLYRDWRILSIEYQL